MGGEGRPGGRTRPGLRTASSAGRRAGVPPNAAIGLGLLACVTAIALAAPALVPAETLDPTRVTAPVNQPPSWAHWLGTDPSGRDVAGLLAWGARVSLLVGVASSVLAVVLGTSVGLAAGHARGWLEAALLRVIDFFVVVPGLVLALALSAVLQPGVWTIVAAIGLTSWSTLARVVRAQTMSIEARPSVERVRALGASGWHVLGRHVLPALGPLVLAHANLAVGMAIIMESTLAFLGLSDPLAPSWGAMLREASETGAATAGFWWFVMPPGLAIVAVVLAFTLVGRGFERSLTVGLGGR